MLSTEPVTRLSRTTTSSPRASNESHRCDPRKPPPPLTTTRAISELPAGRASCASDTSVLEATPAQRLAVEEVASVDDPRVAQRVGDLVEVEPLELVPLREHHEHLGAVARRVRIGGDLDATEVGGLARRERQRHRRVEGLDRGPSGLQSLHDLERRRVAQIVGAGLEREAPHRDLLAV